MGLFKVQRLHHKLHFNRKSDVREYLKDNPTATQTEVATSVGKLLRMVKTDMATLQEKGLLKREGARKNYLMATFI